jgi:hypothetical protein
MSSASLRSRSGSATARLVWTHFGSKRNCRNWPAPPFKTLPLWLAYLAVQTFGIPTRRTSTLTITGPAAFAIVKNLKLLKSIVFDFSGICLATAAFMPKYQMSSNNLRLFFPTAAGWWMVRRSRPVQAVLDQAFISP